MSAPSLATQAALAGTYPRRFNKREQQLLASVLAYVGANPTYIAKYAGTFTTAGGDASETITVTGAASTDIAIVTVKTAGATPRSIVAAAAGTNSIAVTLSDDPSTDHVLQYVVFRANS